MSEKIFARIETQDKKYSQVNWFSQEELKQAKLDGFIITQLPKPFI
jgi:hypothetical protein